MRSQDKLETYDEEQERMAEYTRRSQEEHHERLDTLRGAVWSLVKPLWHPTVELARFQVKLEERAHSEVFTTIAMLDRFADAAKAVADSAAAAAVAAKQQGAELNLIEPCAAEATDD